MTAATRTQADRLAELRRAVAEAEQRVADLESETRLAPAAYRAAVGALQAHREAVGAGEAADSAKAEAELQAAVDAARSVIEFRPVYGSATVEFGAAPVVGEEPFDPAAEARLAGARRALDDRREDLREFFVGNRAYLDELMADAKRVRANAQESWDAFLADLAEWKRLLTAWPPLLDGNEMGGDELPADPLYALTAVTQADPRWPIPDPRQRGIPLPAPRAIIRRKRRGEDVFDDV
jgi:hypothetical protein